jgi:bifunctional DNA-binding transcriptional regulator/antitoxin component of YhaV-PrlF toxin-antitoxin module
MGEKDSEDISGIIEDAKEVIESGSYISEKENDNPTREELLEEISNLSERLSRTPKKEDLRRLGEFSEWKYRKEFGSWSNALEELGMAPNKVYSDDDLLTELNRVASELSYPPTMSQMDELGEYNPVTYRQRFGSWEEALIEAGLNPKNRSTGAESDPIIGLPSEFPQETLENPFRMGTAFEEKEVKIELVPLDTEYGKNSVEIEANSFSIPEDLYSSLGLFDEKINWETENDPDRLIGSIKQEYLESPEKTSKSKIELESDNVGVEGYKFTLEMDTGEVNYLLLSVLNIDNSPGISLIPVPEEDCLLPGVVQNVGSSHSLEFYVPSEIGESLDLKGGDVFEFFAREGGLYLKFNEKEPSVSGKKEVVEERDKPEGREVSKSSDESEKPFVGEEVTQQDLLEALVELRNSIAETPSEFNVDMYGKYDTDKYIQEFGSLESALEESGLDPG